ncbi:nitrate- and nitrite sensing domain-containing protein [Streptomyces sp. NPDC059166]|uniref:nitrate- and nitrite sensing domain-containing protein n=1 Tax=Streptomyces sp. NPDC059166 TaxID=3346752 RepID=UPI00369117AD
MSLRTALLVLAIIPGVALAALWAVTSGQTLLDFQRQAAQGLLAEHAGQPSNIVYYNLQEERRLSAEALARPDGSGAALKRQRTLTDKAIKDFQSLSDVSADDAPEEVRDAVGRAREAMNRLPAQRSLVDEGDGDQQEAAYHYYTDLIAVDLELFTALSHVDNGEVTTLGQPLVDLFWAKEMISRSDAILARGWPTGKLSTKDLQEVRNAVSGQSFQTGIKVFPYLPKDEQADWRALTGSSAWAAKTEVEREILRPAAADRSGFVKLGADEKTWRTAMDGVTPRLIELLEKRTDAVMVTGKGTVMSLLLKTVLTSVIGLLAVIAVVWTTWRLTRQLRRRVSGLQERAEELEKALPDVVERLARGEKIDVEAEAAAIETPSEGDDELTRLGDALNQARTSALAAAVKQADQHRGFERLLQRIARRTQQLIGQQLKKLDELEREHEDPEVLEGLFDLDHLTARLRRYEENLVILAGGSPHRRWRKPVPLLDVMRSAQGEVQDYRRVVLDLDGTPWLSERAVGPVSHVLAELIENALTFSRPPSPVEVRAAQVSRGLAIEVEDRGLGMDEDQLAEANELMSRPPRMDVLAHSEDIRLGLYVISRLADQHGLRVEFRPSAFGGTRVVVLVPDRLTVPGPGSGPAAVPSPAAERTPAPEAAAGALPTRVQGRALAGVTALADHTARPRPDDEDGQAYDVPGDPVPAAPGPPLPLEGPGPVHGPFGQGEAAAPPPAGRQRYPDGESFARDTDARAPGVGAYTGQEPYPADGSAYQDGPEQPYRTDGPSYPDGPGQPYDDGSFPVPGQPYAPEQPYADSPYTGIDSPYAGAGRPYEGEERPYMTAAGQYPVPELPYPEPADDFPSPLPDVPPEYPAEYGASGYLTPGPPDLPGPRALPAGPAEAALPAGGEPPLPRRVRQASLVDELRLDPSGARTTAPKPPSWDENPLLRPAPRRAGAAIGAFQRRSRAARAAAEPSDSPATPSPTREERS